jgi:hypothetical protein
MRKKWLIVCAIVGAGIGIEILRRKKKRRETAWTVDNTLDDVVRAHVAYLHERHPNYAAKFEAILAADREAALGEAAIFSLLRTYFRADPEPADEPGIGGVDFICRRGTVNEFVVEVTSLKPEAVAAHSNIPVDIEDGFGGAFSMTTDQLFSTVQRKADQMANYSCPRVLAITSTHVASDFLLGSQGAEYLLTSEPQITYPVSESGASIGLTTNLRRSVFFAPDATGQQVVPRRQSVSAVLLVSLYENASHVVGLVHPQPARPLNIENFREVPFLRISQWPITGGAIRTEWIVPSPQAKSFLHNPVSSNPLTRFG